MLANRREIGHRVDDLIRHVFGMRGQKAKPIETTETVNCRQKIGQPIVVREIVAVGIHGLTEQRHIAHAVVDQLGDLAHDIVDRAARFLAAAVGHDAVGAKKVAAVDDRHVGGDAGVAR